MLNIAIDDFIINILRSDQSARYLPFGEARTISGTSSITETDLTNAGLLGLLG